MGTTHCKDGKQLMHNSIKKYRELLIAEKSLFGYLMSMLKIGTASLIAFFLWIMFVMEPLVIHKQWIIEGNDIPLNVQFTMKGKSIKPLFSPLFCQAYDAKLLYERHTTDNKKLVLPFVKEPFGFNDNSKPKSYEFSHYLPNGVVPGDKLIAWKKVYYSCLGVTRIVLSPKVTINVVSPI